MRFIFSRLFGVLSFVGIVLLSFVSTAFAAGAAAPDDNGIGELARPVYDAIMSGHYLAATALALALAIALAKRYAPGKLGTFLHSDPGGALAALGMAFFGAVATATAGGVGWGAFSWAMLGTAAKLAALAAGGYALIKKLVIEPFKASSWYQTKAPMWLKSALQFVLWMFDKPNAGVEATKAGDEAVAANPAGGTEAVVGKPETF